MASSGNFCTMNPLALVAGGTLSNGNLQLSSSANADYHCDGTMGVNPNDTQGYYFEVRLVSRITNMAVGLGRNVYWTGSYGSGNNQSYVMAVGSRSAETGAGDVYTLTSVNTSFRQTFADGDIIGIAVKGGKIWFAKNNTYINSGNPAGDSGEAISGATGTLLPIWSHGGGSGTNTQYFNFGQDDTFGGAITGEGNTDENGFGVFKYTPPTGFLALCSANLPISSDIDPAQTDDNFPQKQFNAITYTGNASTQAITGVGFKPDLFWFHRRDYTGSYNTGIIDSSRGVGLGLYPDRTNADTSFTSDFNSFDTDGVTLKAGSSANINNNSSTFVAWMWRANGGTTSSNSDGDITSTVQANTNAGFSIVTYTGDNTDHRGVGYGSANIGHGLDKAPEFIITKRRDGTGSWYTYHASAGIGYLLLESGGGFQSGAVPFGPSAPTTTTFGGYSANNNSGHTYVCYCWHSVEGYSKFGKYNANTNANGPFVYTGFRPRMIFIKMTVSGDGWGIWDSERGPSNVIDNIVSWNNSNAESSNSYFNVDFLSNGFKIRSSNAQVNSTSYDPYIWGAWGDVPFKYGNTF